MATESEMMELYNNHVYKRIIPLFDKLQVQIYDIINRIEMLENKMWKVKRKVGI